MTTGMRRIATLLPDTPSKTLRATVVVLAAGCVCAAIMACVVAVPRGDGPGMFVALCLFALAFGLWRLNAFARVLTVIALWALVLGSILDAFIPLSVSEHFRGELPPAKDLLLFHVVPYVLPALIALHLLGRYKTRFR